MNTRFHKLKIPILLLCIAIILTACTVQDVNRAYLVVYDNVPQFAKTELTTESFEAYSELDALGRCGPALACIGSDIMPTEERGAIGQVKPSGWHLAKYDIVDGKYLYNRCHLIGYQLTGENANEKNLMTGTRYMNVEGMLPFENMVAEYIEETDNHVMYRVTPIFEGNNLLATGVQMEALSVEDNGKGISFNVFVINMQPGIEINYLDGTNRLNHNVPAITEMPIVEKKPIAKPTPNNEDINESIDYVLNTNTRKFHRPACSSAKDMKQKNKEEYHGTREDLIDRGYSPCGVCKP